MQNSPSEAGTANNRVIDKVGAPRRKHVLPRDAEDDIERVFPDPLIAEKALDPVRPSPTPKQPAIRLGGDRLHKGAFREEKTRGAGKGGYRTRIEPSLRNKSAEKCLSSERRC